MRSAISIHSALLYVLLSGCADPKATCGSNRPPIPEGQIDQYCSYMAPVSHAQPLQVTVDGAFTDWESRQIQTAADEWNVWSVARSGAPLYELHFDGEFVETNKPATLTDCGFPGAGNALTIVKESSFTHWKSLGLDARNPGVTVRCSIPGEKVDRQVVMMQTDNLPAPQFRGVALHELGHAAGLDHSCASTDSPLYRACQDLGDEHPYVKAIMYPNLRHWTKESLEDNDRERMAIVLKR